MTDKKNLSELLFKPQFNYPETSSLMSPLRSIPGSLTRGGDHWYRNFDPLEWHFRGLSYLEVKEVLSRIAKSDRKRTQDVWLDTVIGYQSGNWIYEFLSQSVIWQQRAEQYRLTNDYHKSYQAWLTASLLAGFASYPYCRQDDFAGQAHIFAHRHYHEAMSDSPYKVKELTFKIDNKVVKALLHTPLKKDETPRAFPIVFLCAGLGQLQIDFHHYFLTHLAPLGIGLLTVDSPGIGHSKAFNLSQNTTIIHKGILEQIRSVPLIDDSKIILLGYQFGANIAMRLAYLMPHKIKGVINISPVIHQLFVNHQMQTAFPPIYRDIIANRLGLNGLSDQQLMAELAFFSLKSQGLLAKPCSVPILNIHYDGDIISDLSETKLITSTKKVSLIHLKKLMLKQSLKQAYSSHSTWLKTLIK